MVMQLDRPEAETTDGTRTDYADCCIVGAGPAGAILALLLAREGVRITLLEAMHDFDRDFRGDTLMPSTLELVDQLGLMQRLETLPHARVPEMRINTERGSQAYIDLRRIKSRFAYVMNVPQAKFLELITSEAARYPNFRLVMGARVRELVERDGAVRGVVYSSPEGLRHVRAQLTVGADGRFSRVRQLAGFELERNDEPLDMLWFRIRNSGTQRMGRPGLYTRAGLGYLVIVPRDAQWQIGYALPKGRYKELQTAGLPALREAVAALVPWLGDDVADLQDWKQTSLLSIESGQVRQWYRPGVLLIGDAAHVMSPVGGVGINCAIQDAVEAANALAWKLRGSQVTEADLRTVQWRRQWAVSLTQACQRAMQRNMVAGSNGLSGVLFRLRPVRNALTGILALGPRRVRLRESGASSSARPAR
jgi:2-polyprenyl-6-methoxyphenol hydroxylase-like FAD-dependent oxidoreductase